MTDPLIGRLVGNYRIESPIGEGGMGAVYKAVHGEIGNVIAIKVLGLGRESSAKDQARFLAEAKTTATLNHTNIVRIIDFTAQDGIYYMLMEFIEGESLDQVLAREGGPLRLSRAATILAFVARALDYAHNRGVVHRDVKPSNVLIAKEDDRIVLTDFGIAKLTEGTTLDLTRDGAAVGTPTYMSPEQAKGQPVDGRSDVYSLGVVLYQMLTGAAPFAGAAMEVLSKHVSQPPPAPRELNPNLTGRQEGILLKALEKDPEKRYPRAGELASAFLATVTGSAEVAIETGSRWERFREGRAWGRVLRFGRFLRSTLFGGLGFLLRSLLSLALAVVVVTIALVVAASLLLSRGLERAIAESEWLFSQVGPGYQAEFLPEQLARGIETGARQLLPGTFSDVVITPRSSRWFTVGGSLQGIPLALDVTVEAVEGRPLFTLDRLNGYPLPVVGGLIARGVNQGFDQALDKASASIPSIEMTASSITVVIDGSATTTEAVTTTHCVEGVSLTDDFTDIYSGWAQSYKAPEAEVGYKEGAYSLRTLTGNIIVNQALPCVFTTFDATLEVSPAGDPGDASWGLVFFEIDPDNYWVFQINALGWYSVEQIAAGEHSLVVAWTKSDAIKASETNALRVVVTGKGEVYANGARLDDFELPEPEGGIAGSFGFLVRSASQAQVEILFDNLTVKTSE